MNKAFLIFWLKQPTLNPNSHRFDMKMKGSINLLAEKHDDIC